jgi:hypothetical protein
MSGNVSLEALEELDHIRAYDEAKSEPSDPIPFDQAVDEARRGRLSHIVLEKCDIDGCPKSGVYSFIQ